MKLCNVCGDPKHANQFRKGEWVCKKCRSTQRQHHRRLHEYGLTFDEFSTLLDQQEGKCAICGHEFEGEPMVDHDHETRRVRGLLCHHCNTGLGLFRDNATTLEIAAHYLREHKGEE
jgi:DNA-directed RNA polymerase subunit RPC12/RpoP